MKTVHFPSVSRSHVAVSFVLALLTVLCAGCFTMVPQFQEAPITATPQSIKVVLLLDSAWSSARYEGGVFGEPHTYLLGDSLVKYATSAAQKSFREVVVVNGDTAGANAAGAVAVLHPALARVQTVESATTGGGQKAILLVDWTITSPDDGRVLWKNSIDAEGDDRNGHGSIRARGREAFEDAYNQLFIKTVAALSNAKLAR
jgi:hypothetical protein